MILPYLSRRSLHWGLQLVVAVSLTLAYWFQPDWLAGLTIFPAPCWLVAGLIGLYCSQPRFTEPPAEAESLTPTSRLRLWHLAGLIWLMFALLHVQESRSLIRSMFPVAAAREGHIPLRLVTLNCGDGGARGVEDLIPLRPDLVFVQEGPSRAALESWAQALWGEDGHVAWGVDCSLLGRGRLLPVTTKDGHFTGADWSPEPNLRLRVVSLRLAPPPVRFDVWSGDYWRADWNLRQQHRRELWDVSRYIRSSQMPCIVAGDFNSPAGDPPEKFLSVLGMRDAHDLAGRGGGTPSPTRIRSTGLTRSGSGAECRLAMWSRCNPPVLTTDWCAATWL